MTCNTTLTKEEITRYSRQIRLAEIGSEGQKKIKGTSVLVVGAGALGCPVLKYLTAAGVGTLGIVDEALHPLDVPTCEEFGVIGSIPGMIGSLQATEVLKIILI